ncbi:hypothetical protein LTS18_008505, partial [Coniosporium uncinatum]
HGFSEQEIVQETDMVRDQVRNMVYEENWYWENKGSPSPWVVWLSDAYEAELSQRVQRRVLSQTSISGLGSDFGVGFVYMSQRPRGGISHRSRYSHQGRYSLEAPLSNYLGLGSGFADTSQQLTRAAVALPTPQGSVARLDAEEIRREARAKLLMEIEEARRQSQLEQEREREEQREREQERLREHE